MPLPELNTGGLDIGNTLLKIRGLQQQDQENQYRKETIQGQNALRVLTEKKQAAEEERAKRKEVFDQADKASSYILAAPEPVQGKLYEDYYNSSIEKGMPVPHPSVFQKDGTWDSKGFGAYVTRIKTLLNSKVGTEERLDVVNPKFNPSASPSIDNPKFISATFRNTVDGPQLVEGAPITPKIDQFAKEAKDQEQQDKTFNETLRHNKVTEGISASSEERQKGKDKGEKIKYKEYRDALTGGLVKFKEGDPNDDATLANSKGRYQVATMSPNQAKAEYNAFNKAPTPEKKPTVGIIDSIKGMLPSSKPPVQPTKAATAVTKKTLPAGMSKEDWKAEAHRTNPNMTGVQIEAEFNKRYTE